MALERQSLTTIGYRKAAVTGQQDALKEVASKLSTLKDAALALSADSTWTQKQTVESSDPARVAVTHARRRRHRRPVDLGRPPRLLGPAPLRLPAPAPSTHRARPPAPRRSRSRTQPRQHRRSRSTSRPARPSSRSPTRSTPRPPVPPSPRWSRTPTAWSSSSCRRARPARTRTSRRRPSTGGSPRTAPSTRATGNDLQAAYRRRRRRPAALRLERGRERDPGRPAHAQGRDHGAGHRHGHRARARPRRDQVQGQVVRRRLQRGRRHHALEAHRAARSRTRRATSRPPAASSSATPG